jgi:hypothetical protein
VLDSTSGALRRIDMKNEATGLAGSGFGSGEGFCFVF